MKSRHKRFLFVALAILGVGIAVVLAISAMRSNISYFFSPSQVAAGEAPADESYLPPEVAASLRPVQAGE